MRKSDWVLLKCIAEAVPYEHSDSFNSTVFKLLDRSGCIYIFSWNGFRLHLDFSNYLISVYSSVRFLRLRWFYYIYIFFAFIKGICFIYL